MLMDDDEDGNEAEQDDDSQMEEGMIRRPKKDVTPPERAPKKGRKLVDRPTALLHEESPYMQSLEVDRPSAKTKKGISEQIIQQANGHHLSNSVQQPFMVY